MPKKQATKEAEKTEAETSTNYPVSVTVDLKGVAVGDSHLILIKSVRAGAKDGSDYIVATVESSTLTGNTIWFKGKYGLSNGYASLLKNSNGVIEGEWIYSKVESTKSPVGYAHRWVKV